MYNIIHKITLKYIGGLPLKAKKIRKVISVKIEKLSDNKIRITLSSTELKERHLDFQALRYNTPEAQTLFLDMMKQAENEHGFKTSNCQLFIEAASINDGQFIVTVTKIQEKALPPVPQKRRTLPEIKVRKKQTSTSGKIIYKFDEFEQICELIKSKSIPLDLPSTLYEYNNTFFLVLKPSPKTHLLILEFGEMVKDLDIAEGFLSEHGNKIIDSSALNTINENFVKV